MKYLVYALRPKHWIKNFFVLLPLVFAKKLFLFPANVRVLAAFFFFCMMSSAVYAVNDVFDLEKDRRHRTKKLRPFASGKVRAADLRLAAAVLAAVSLAGAYLVDPALCAVLGAYFALNLLYSRWLKHLVLLDVFTIGIFFVMRVTAGSIAARTVISHWMIFMVVLLAMFLGFHKRRQELMAGSRAADSRGVLVHYSAYFLDQVISVLTASIVVVYMLYTVDARTVELFGTKNLIWSIPFVYYGIFRYLYLVHKRKQGEDPTVAFLSDKLMGLNVLLWVLVCIAVIYFRP